MNRFKYTLCERKIDFLSASSLFLSPGLASGLAVPASGKSRGKSKPATADAFNDNLLMVKILAKNTTEGHHPVFAFFLFFFRWNGIHPPSRSRKKWRPSPIYQTERKSSTLSDSPVEYLRPPPPEKDDGSALVEKIGRLCNASHFGHG